MLAGVLAVACVVLHLRRQRDRLAHVAAFAQYRESETNQQQELEALVQQLQDLDLECAEVRAAHA